MRCCYLSQKFVKIVHWNIMNEPVRFMIFWLVIYQQMILTELPSDFIHSPPKGYSYEVQKHNASTISIWLLHHARYVYHDSDQCVRTIWGFYKPKTRKYYAPINSKKVGNEVDIMSTRPYTSMQLNLNPLENALFGSTWSSLFIVWLCWLGSKHYATSN